MKLHKYRVILNLFMGSDIVLFSICVEPFFYRVVCTGVHGTVGTDQGGFVVRDSSLGENCSAQQYVSEMMPDSKQTQLSLHISTPENRGDSAR